MYLCVNVSLQFVIDEEEGRDEGDVWGHDGWNEIIHDNSRRKRFDRYVRFFYFYSRELC